jgi:hypothetical protein
MPQANALNSIRYTDTEPVSDEMGRGQPACQEEWKMCRKKRRIVMLI